MPCYLHKNLNLEERGIGKKTMVRIKVQIIFVIEKNICHYTWVTIHKVWRCKLEK